VAESAREIALVSEPEELNKHYLDLFKRILTENIPEYSKTEKQTITPLGVADSVQRFDPTGRIAFSPPLVGHWSDYVYFHGKLSADKIEPEVEGVVRLLAHRLAASVETLVAETSPHGKPVCFDLFKLSDGSPNLQTFYCVKGNEATVDDPTGSITGWFAYRVRFTVSTKFQ
jgi:hypothetical protein